MVLKVKDPFGVWQGTVLIGGTAALIDGNGKLLDETIFLDDSRRNEFRLSLLNMKWGNAKELEIRLHITYKIFAEMMGPYGEGYIKLVQPWDIAYLGAGALFHAKPWRIVGKPVIKMDYVLAYDIRPDQNPHEADETWASAILRVAGGHKKDGITVGLQVGPVGASGTMPGSQGSGQLDFAFNVKCFFTGRPVKAADPITMPEGLLDHFVSFERDSADPSQGTLERLEDSWADVLKEKAPELAAAIRDGKVVLTLHGHASDTGSDARNLELSAQRVNVVVKEIRNLFSTRVVIVPIYHGKSKASLGENRVDRRVKIEIDPRGAKAAIAAAKAASKVPSL